MYRLYQSKNIIICSIKKALIGSLIGAFLFNDVAYASDYQNLAPKLRLPQEKFKEIFRDGYERLREKAVDNHIAKTILCRVTGRKYNEITSIDIDSLGTVEITKYFRTRRDRVRIDHGGKTVWQDILIVADPDLFAFRGQFAKLGLWKWNGLPVIWIDEKFYYDQDKLEEAAAEISAEDLKASVEILNHEKSEIEKWERKRLELLDSLSISEDPRVFRDKWVKNNPEAKERASWYHRQSGDLRHLFIKYQDLLNWGELHRAFLESGELFDSEDMTDTNIAAGPEPRARDRVRR
ncbi:MAG: hypothetical protein Q8N91_04725, partial [Candidatus Omnitrophota bacterium]|nr:hypothetical protein [Candidatus Omnitrophota bacterium]